MATTRIIVPTGHLGTTPFEPESFRRGCAENPDYIVADSGSADIGPHPLGSGRPSSDPEWQYRDLEEMVLRARELDVPMIVGSAADTGSNTGVDSYLEMLVRIAKEHNLPQFRVAGLYSELPVSTAINMFDEGVAFSGLNGRPDANRPMIERSDHIVAVMGARPILSALQEGADVIVTGRASDPSIFAAPLIHKGHELADAYLAGKALECASFCAEPFMGKETILGEVSRGRVDLTAMHPEQRCTPLSVAGHTMYERVTPYEELVPGGRLDLSECTYEQLDAKTTRVTGQTFEVNETYAIKIEGSGKVAERRITIAGVRDPHTIEHIDQAIELARGKLESRFGPVGDTYDIYFHLYGKNAVMGSRDTAAPRIPHELGIVVDVSAEDPTLAERVCQIAAKALFYARLPNVKGTAGTSAIYTDQILVANAVYQWTLNHTVVLDDPDTLFHTEVRTVGV